MYLPTGSPKRERGEYGLFLNGFRTAPTVAARIPVHGTSPPRSSLRAKGDEPGGVRLKPRWRRVASVDQVDAVGDRREHGVEALADAPGPTGEVHNQGVAAHACRLPRQDRRRHMPQRRLPHQFAKARQHPRADPLRRLRSNVAERWARAAGRHHEAAAIGGEVTNRGGDRVEVVRYDPLTGLPRACQHLAEVVADRGATLVGILPTAGTIGDRQDSDERGCRRLVHA